MGALSDLAHCNAGLVLLFESHAVCSVVHSVKRPHDRQVSSLKKEYDVEYLCAMLPSHNVADALWEDDSFMDDCHLTECVVLCSTMFLMGPVRQIVKMFEKGRILATLIYIAAMFLTLFSAIKVCLPLCEMPIVHAMLISLSSFLRVLRRGVLKHFWPCAAAKFHIDPSLLHHPTARYGMVSVSSLPTLLWKIACHCVKTELMTLTTLGECEHART